MRKFELWHYENDPNDKWYQFRIYSGERLIANIPTRGPNGREIALQIVRDHNEALAREGGT